MKEIDETGDRQLQRLLELIKLKSLWHDKTSLVQKLKERGFYSAKTHNRDYVLSVTRYVELLRVLENEIRKELDADFKKNGPPRDSNRPGET